MRMHKTELSQNLMDILHHNERRVQIINYILAFLLAIILIWALYAVWRNSRQEKIESITLVPGSVKVIGATTLCPGDSFIIQYTIDVVGTGVITVDDSIEYANRTVAFSGSRREIIPTSGERVYEETWTIPPEPEMLIDGESKWVPGLYVLHIAIAAANNYVSRYTDPVWFDQPFVLRSDC